MRKTDRIYGAKVELVLYTAELLGRITGKTFEDVMMRSHADRILHYLWETGRLIKVKRGTRGCNGSPSIYELNPATKG